MKKAQWHVWEWNILGKGNKTVAFREHRVPAINGHEDGNVTWVSLWRPLNVRLRSQDNKIFLRYFFSEKKDFEKERFYFERHDLIWRDCEWLNIRLWGHLKLEITVSILHNGLSYTLHSVNSRGYNHRHTRLLLILAATIQRRLEGKGKFKRAERLA